MPSRLLSPGRLARRRRRRCRACTAPASAVALVAAVTAALLLATCAMVPDGSCSDALHPPVAAPASATLSMTPRCWLLPALCLTALAAGAIIGRVARPHPADRGRPGAKDPQAPAAREPGPPEDDPTLEAAWSPGEQRCIRDMLAALQRARAPPPPENLLLQVAWSRQLDAEASAALWRQHLEAAMSLDIMDVSDEDVRKAYSMGFCVRAGEDVEGRPIIWVRLAQCEVAKLTPSLAVRNTWLAHDATLCGSANANRHGICFVYDLHGVGRQNVTFNLRYLRAAIWGATSHPMHVSRVWLLDAPTVFMAAWHMGRGFLPHHLREVVRFCSTGARSGEPAAHLAPVCAPGELPAYLGGDSKRFGGDYAEWMFARLQGQALAYRREGSTFSSADAAESSQRLHAVHLC